MVLFYLKLEREGFVLNPYDPVANKMVNGIQMTLKFHVDDQKISHMSRDDVTKTINLFKWQNGKMVDFAGADL